MKMIFFDINGYEKNFMEEFFPDALYLSTPILEISEITPEIEDAKVISVFTSSRITNDVLKKFKNLELIALRSVGFSHVDLEYCKEKGIRVVNTPHYGDYTVAEFAFGLLLNVVRKINIANTDFENGDIKNRRYTGIELHGKTVGVIGVGSIGKRFIHIAQGFSMNVLGYDIHHDESLGIEYVTLDELCERSDFISLHSPLTQENYHMLNSDKFKKMKKGVVIVNTARGELIDTFALYEGLMSRKVSGAGLDVIESEEITAHEDDYLYSLNSIDKEALEDYMLTQKLMKIPTVIITPHIAYDTKEAIDRILNTTVSNIKNFLNGNDANFVV